MRMLHAACAAALLALSACGESGSTYEESAASYDMVAAEAPAEAGVVETERYEHAIDNPIHLAAQDPVSTFSIDVDTASYTNVRRFLSEGRLPPQDAVRIEELINYFDYDYAPPAQREEPFSTTISLAPSPWAEVRQLVHIGLQGYNIERAERPPLNLVLLIDTSGSMNDPNKLPLALDGFRMLSEQLTEDDHVSIVAYAGAAGAVLEPTRGNDQRRILDALNNLHAGGSTAGGEGLALAYSLAEENFQPNAVNRVILATDGDFNVGITDSEQLQDFVERKRESGIYLSVLGFGGGNYNDALMQRLAQNGNGVAAYIDSEAEAQRVLSEQASGALFPIADDVKIQVEFNPERVAEYRLIGYETRALRREDFNNDRVDAGEISAGHSSPIVEIGNFEKGGTTLTIGTFVNVQMGDGGNALGVGGAAINGNLTANSTLTRRLMADVVRVYQSSVLGTTNITMGSGSSIVDLQSVTLRTTNISTGAGGDIVFMDNISSIAGGSVFNGALSIDLGTGDVSSTQAPTPTWSAHPTSLTAASPSMVERALTPH